MPDSTAKQAKTKAQQRQETVQALVSQARQLFATRGYPQVSLAAIVAAAGVTKGALYHHFPRGKEQLFRSVVAQVHTEVADQVETAAGDADPWTQLMVGSRTFLASSTEPTVQQIMLIDAPAVLGWGVWRELDAGTSRQHLRDIVTRLIEEGVIAAGSVEPVVHLLSGAMNEAALWIAESEDRDRELAEAFAVLSTMLESLRTPEYAYGLELRSELQQRVQAEITGFRASDRLDRERVHKRELD